VKPEITNPRLPLYIDSPIGLIPSAFARIVIWAFTSEGFMELSDDPVTQSTLAYITGVVAGAGFANCREKAYMGALAASLMPEMKQVVVLGLDMANGGSHAVSVGCTVGKDVFDLSGYAGATGDEFDLPRGPRAIALSSTRGQAPSPVRGQGTSRPWTPVTPGSGSGSVCSTSSP